MFIKDFFLFFMNVPKSSKTSKSITISRDEMNLAEFPLAVLSTRVNPNIKTLEFQDTIYTQDKKPITRKWIITGADKFGLPTSSDDEVLMGLLKLTADKDFKSQKVEFTRYELLKVLNWTTEGRSYTRLQRSLDRLSGVKIKAANAFYDNKTKENCTKLFGIIDAYEINSGRGEQNQPSYFIWGETIFDSFQKGNIKRLDLDFYLSLKSAISKRLFRYLDKRFWQSPRIEMDLFRLAYEKIGISRNFKYASSLKQQIEPALNELLEKDFIKKYEFIGKGALTKVIFYKTESAQTSVQSTINENKNVSFEDTKTSKQVFNEYDGYSFNASQGDEEVTVIDITQDTPISKLTSELTEKLLARGIKEGQIKKLLKDKTFKSLTKILNIISYFDDLVRRKSTLVSRSPVGFLYRAVEREQLFYLPKEFDSQKDKEHTEEKVSKKVNSIDEEMLRQTFMQERGSQIKEIRNEMEIAVLKSIEDEARKSLSNMKGVISDQLFEKAVTDRVDDKIASLFALADFNEWLKERKNL